MISPTCRNPTPRGHKPPSPSARLVLPEPRYPARFRGAPRQPTKAPMTKHSFADVAETLIAALLKAADDNLVEAQNLKASVVTLTEGITDQVKEHTRLLNDMDTRLR